LKRALNQRSPEAKRKHKEGYFRRTYGITMADYDAMIIKQENRCAICERMFEEGPRKAHVDHNHVTGKLRDLLCCACNQGLGQFGDSKEMMQRAIKYLEKHETKTEEDSF